LPEAQAAAVPQWQAPSAPQLSAVSELQALQAAAAVPQAEADGTVQVLPLQQPVAQFARLQLLLHTPLVQVPEPQATQVAPAAPQAFFTLPALQAPLAQQPAQVAGSHSHAPATQCRPVPQAVLPPQVQAPVAEQVSAVFGSHAAQAPPEAPQAANERISQTPLAQQPLVHPVASQTQPPLAQCIPEAQAGPEPHWQAPPAQESAVTASQARQAAPPLAQVETESVRQVLPLQQPEGQETESHTQAPPTQCCPAQGGLVPQAQLPSAAQLSAAIGSQVLQAAPPVPQALAVGVVQVGPEQQPPPQLVELQVVHTPWLQSPGRQLWHDAPPVPHWSAVPPGRQVVPEQQPAHDEASQRQAPPEQRCPSPQTGPEPHWQVPAAEQESALAASQAWQLAPPVPQAAAVAVLQDAPAQQPVGQEAASQTQVPDEQRWPAAQAGPEPQAQAPAAEQESALAASQAPQAAPPEPHCPALSASTQAVPEQQPEGQESLSQPQAPARQCWPAPQGAAAPQAQDPAAEQESALRASQTAQAAAPAPQVAVEGALQVEPEQQPAGQLARSQSLQTPPLQVAGSVHAWQSAPPVPQEVGLVPGRQAVPEQQPEGQEVESQMQAPLAQRCPSPQAAAEPQRHSPAAVQVSALAASQARQALPPVPQAATEALLQAPPEQQPLGQLAASQTQAPPSQRWPAAQPGQLPQRHWPADEQPSLVAISQVTQVPPRVPQEEAERAVHFAPEQQPSGQLVASQVQAPARQRWPGSHSVLPPHWQSPAAEQESALPASQALQTPPPAAQEVTERTEQVAPEQQPSGQVLRLQLEQAPSLHCWPPGQASQAAPALPQDETFLPDRQVCPWQQPAQDSESQTQLPPAQRRPGPHGGLTPHWQAPEAEQLLAAVSSQAVHSLPPEPQVAKERVRQASPAQQPDGQEAELHTHCPPSQRCPGPQAASLPHLQLEPAQPSARWASQLWQAPPPLPQAAASLMWQAPATQQPSGQLVVSQTQAPRAQRWPAWQAGPVPQLQAPSAEQVSESRESQARHAAPGAPQLRKVEGRHASPRQQPAGQESAVQAQAPSTQSWVPSQAWQAPPPLPQASARLPALHSLRSQQPLAHESPSQMQLPARQRRPSAQAGPAPQRQAPSEQVSPLPQAGPGPQRQAPSTQVSPLAQAQPASGVEEVSRVTTASVS
jgi:hypothetical protein